MQMDYQSAGYPSWLPISGGFGNISKVTETSAKKIAYQNSLQFLPGTDSKQDRELVCDVTAPPGEWEAGEANYGVGKGRIIAWDLVRNAKIKTEKLMDKCSQQKRTDMAKYIHETQQFYLHLRLDSLGLFNKSPDCFERSLDPLESGVKNGYADLTFVRDSCKEARDSWLN